MQDQLHATLGDESNAIIWPREEKEDEEEQKSDMEEDDEYDVENPKNQRFMRLGTFSTLRDRATPLIPFPQPTTAGTSTSPTKAPNPPTTASPPPATTNPPSPSP